MSDQIAASVLTIGVDVADGVSGLTQFANVAKQTEAQVAASAKKVDDALKAINAAGDSLGESASKRLVNTVRAQEAAIQKRNATLEESIQIDLRMKGVSEDVARSMAARAAAAERAAETERKLAAEQKATADALKAQAQAQLAAAGAADDFAKRMGMVGVSAGQAKNALRQLPAQFTDIWVSLASGQQPITVFLQQGGQIKDMFGGVGNAGRALLSVLTPMRLAIGGAGAAIVGLGMAYKQGSEEADNYRKSLVLTGNAAGTTVGQLNEVAAAVAKNVGTQSQAADALAQLASTGKIAAGDMGKLAEAAIRLEREGGPAVKETVKAFADLAKEPSKAVAKLNEDTNFLTLSLYKQIKALEEQGKTADAAALAQTAYADAVSARAKTLEANLGTLEKAWRGISETAKKAWDAMLDVGRQDTSEQAIAKVQQRIAQLQGRLSGGRIGATLISDAFASDEEIKRQLAAMQQLEQALKSGAETAAKLAAEEAKRAAETKAGIKATDDAAEAAKKLAKERDKLIQQGRELVQALDLKDAGFNANFITEMEKINALAAAKALSDESQKRAISELIQQQPFYIARIKEEEAARKELLKVLADEEDARSDAQREADKADAAADKRVEQIENETNAIRDQIVELRLGKAARQEAVAARLQERIAGLEAERAAIGDDISNPRLLQIERERAALEKLKQSRIDLASAVTEREAAKEAEKAAEAAQREWDRTADSIRSGLTDAFRRAFESGEDFGTAFAKVIEREIKSRIATALAGSLADLVMAAAGIQAAGGKSGTNYAQAGNALSNLYSMGNTAYGYGQSLYGWATGASAAGTTYGTSATIGGTVAQSSATKAALYGAEGYGSTAGTTTAASSSGMSSVTAGWIAAAVLGAMKASSDYSAGFRRDQAKDFANEIGGGGRYIIGSGGVESEWANALSKMGFSDRLADLLSGSTAVSALFGYSKPSIREQGVMGSLGAGDFTGTAYADVTSKAGFVRKLFGSNDKTETVTGAAPEELSRFLDTAAKGIFDKAKEYGEALGLPVDALAGVTKDIKVKLVQAADDTPAEIEKAAKANMDALGEALGGYGDALVAGFADAVKPLAQYGETTVETIERVGTAIVGVNEVLDALGLQALAASVDGGKAALALQDMFGGISGLQQAASGYLGDYYTEAERAALTTKALSKTLADVGLELPTTRDGFRELVEAQQLNTEEGQQAFAALMSVAGAFASVTEAGRSAADIASERAGLEQRLLEVQGDTNALRKIERGALDESNRALFDQIVALEDVKKLLEEATIAARELAGFKEEFAGLDFDIIPDELITKVAELSGGFSSLTSNLSAYYDEFLTAAERGTNSAQSLALTLRAVGVEVPNTVEGLQTLGRDGFRALVDEATASGNGGALAALLKVSGAFADLVPSAEDAAEAFEDLRDVLVQAVEDALEGVRRAVQAKIDEITTQYEADVGLLDARETRARDAYKTAKDNIDARRTAYGDGGVGAIEARIKASQIIEGARVKEFNAAIEDLTFQITRAQKAFKEAFDAIDTRVKNTAEFIGQLSALKSALDGTLRAMRPIGSEMLDRQQAQLQIAQALAYARVSGGRLPDAKALAPALATVAKPSDQLFSTQADYLRDMAYTRNNLNALAEITDLELTTADKQLTELEKIRALMEKSQFATPSEAPGIRSELSAALTEYNKVTAAGIASLKLLTIDRAGDPIPFALSNNSVLSLANALGGVIINLPGDKKDDPTTDDPTTEDPTTDDPTTGDPYTINVTVPDIEAPIVNVAAPIVSVTVPAIDVSGIISQAALDAVKLIDVYSGLDLAAKSALKTKLEEDDEAARTSFNERMEALRDELDLARETYKDFIDLLDDETEYAYDTLEAELAKIETDRKALKDAFDDQLKEVKKTLTEAEKIANAALGIDTSIKSIDQAMLELKTKIDDLKKLESLSSLSSLSGGMTSLTTAINGLPDAIKTALQGLNLGGGGGGTPLPTGSPRPVLSNTVGSEWSGWRTYTGPMPAGPNGLFVTPDGYLVNGQGIVQGRANTTPTGFEGDTSNPSVVLDVNGASGTGGTPVVNPVVSAAATAAQINAHRSALQAYASGDYEGNGPADFKAYALSKGLTLAQAAQIAEYEINSLRGWLGTHAFAAGGMHTGGLRLVGEEGPELEVTGPARYYSADQTMAMLRDPSRANDVLVAEVKQLRAQVAELQAAMVATATNTGKTARQLDRWDGDGMPDVRA